MDNLEKYIKDNAEAFNDAGLPEGHLGRFIAKLDAASSVGEPGRSTTSRHGIIRILWTSLAVAAALAMVLVLNKPSSERNGDHEGVLLEKGSEWFAEVGDDQADICRAYYENVGELYGVILSKYPDGSMDDVLTSIAEETIPLVDQLPDEMDPEVRAVVLKEYYGHLLDGLERINKSK